MTPQNNNKNFNEGSGNQGNNKGKTKTQNGQIFNFLKLHGINSDKKIKRGQNNSTVCLVLASTSYDPQSPTRNDSEQSQEQPLSTTGQKQTNKTPKKFSSKESEAFLKYETS